MNKELWFKHSIAILSVLGVFILLHILLVKEIPTNNKDVVNIAIGALIGGLIARIAGHYFPSSSKPTDTTTTTNP